MELIFRQATAFVPLPNGSYIAEFQDAAIVEINDPKAGGKAKKLKFSWRVASGEHAGKIATALTDLNVTAGNLAGRLFRGMAHREMVDGENAANLIAGFRGQRFLIVIAPGSKGGKPGVQGATIPPEM